MGLVYTVLPPAGHSVSHCNETANLQDDDTVFRIYIEILNFLLTPPSRYGLWITTEKYGKKYRAVAEATCGGQRKGCAA
jgi:hypothetical protein